jgi:glycosyltransferase involved in cell wall biosynthesis
MRIKLLQATNTYAPAYSFGGPIRLFEMYADMLRQNNFQVDVLTSDLLTRETCQGAKIVELGENGKIEYVAANKTKFLIKRNVYLNFSLYLKIISRLKNYEFVQFCEFRGILPLLVLFFAGWYKVKVIHHSFGMISQKRGPKKTFYDALFLRFFLKSVTICFAENEVEKLQYLSLGIDKSKITILPHPIVISEKILGASLPKKSGKLTLCFVGRIHPTKGVINCVNLVESLRPYFSGIELTIMGNDDGDLAAVKQRVTDLNLQEDVHFLDASYDDSRFYLYRECDFFVILPNDNLQTSLASMEAMAAGTPVINNSNSQIDGWNEFVCSIDDRPMSEIADRLKELLRVDKNHISAKVLNVHSYDAVMSTLTGALVAKSDQV